MIVTVLGPGRIGLPIAKVARNAGHEVTILARPSSPSGDVARAAGFWVSTPGGMTESFCRRIFQRNLSELIRRPDRLEKES